MNEDSFRYILTYTVLELTAFGLLKRGDEIKISQFNQLYPHYKKNKAQLNIQSTLPGLYMGFDKSLIITVNKDKIYDLTYHVIFLMACRYIYEDKLEEEKTQIKKVLEYLFPFFWRVIHSPNLPRLGTDKIDFNFTTRSKLSDIAYRQACSILGDLILGKVHLGEDVSDRLTQGIPFVLQHFLCDFDMFVNVNQRYYIRVDNAEKYFCDCIIKLYIPYCENCIYFWDLGRLSE